MFHNCSINGVSISPDKAALSVFDNSLFYADGLFETLLAVGDRVIFIHDHLRRMTKGAALIRIKLPVPLSTIESWVVAEVKKNPAPVKKIRVTVTSGNSAFWAGQATTPRIIIIVTAYSIPENPYRLMVSPFRIDQDSPFRNVKTLSFIIEMTSRRTAYSKGYDDAILLNRNGHVAEATSANFFWIRRGCLYTPPLAAGCLDGMIRKHVLKIAAKGGIAVAEKSAPLAEILAADELFITSSLKLIIPVTHLKHDKAYNFPVGPITHRLREKLNKHILRGG